MIQTLPLDTFSTPRNLDATVKPRGILTAHAVPNPRTRDLPIPVKR